MCQCDIVRATGNAQTKSVEYRFGVDKNFFRDQVLASQDREILPVAGKGDNSELKYSCKQVV
jgi:hypothetical protein